MTTICHITSSIIIITLVIKSFISFSFILILYLLNFILNLLRNLLLRVIIILNKTLVFNMRTNITIHTLFISFILKFTIL